MKKITIFMLILLLLFGMFSVFTVSNADNAVDFSNANFEVKYKSSNTCFCIISGISTNSSTTVYWTVTSTNTKPDKSKLDNFEKAPVSSEGKTELNISKYVELNQDLYLYILDATGESFLVDGKKIERSAYPKDYRLFSDYFNATSDGLQLGLKDVAIASNTTRKINVKIGKITDTAILNKIKNNASTGFSELLTYAKTATAIYDNQISYKTADSSKIPLGIPISSLDNKAYYFAYILADDENGKYYPIEGVTLALSDVFDSTKMSVSSDAWYLFFYGRDKFQWSEFGSGGTETNNPGTVTPKTDPDETIATTILPKTGISTPLIIIMIGIAFVSFVLDRKYKKWKDI